MIQPFIVATAGHVDHGKSSLVRALTGTDPDRLPEEKARGITIDLGFAHLLLPAPPGNPHGATHYSCGIVDVPGHEAFVRNMVAGVGAVDLALLTVASDDGWMPQTEEHLQILLHLGVNRAVVALTRSDLTASTRPIADQVRERLAGTPVAEAALVATSTTTGAGLAELRHALATALAAAPAPRDIGKPRVWIDRVFSLHGSGTIVTGTLTGGPLECGAEVVVAPGGPATRIRALHSHGRERQTASPGMRVGLNLPDVTLATDRRRGQAGRGRVVTLRGLDACATTWEVLLKRSDRIPLGRSTTSRPLRSGTRVHVHIGTAKVAAQLRLHDQAALLPGSRTLARLRLEEPAHAMVGDRFVLRDGSEQATLGGGIVLDAGAGTNPIPETDRRARLRACLQAGPDLASLVRLHAGPETRRPIPASEVLRQSCHGAAEIEAVVSQLVEARELVPVGNALVGAVPWTGWLEIAKDAVDAHHREFPGERGLALAQLKAHLARAGAEGSVVSALLTHLNGAGIRVDGQWIARRGHAPALPHGVADAGDRIRRALATRPLDPPGRRTLAADLPSREALARMIQEGEVVELGPDLVLPSTAFAVARDAVVRHLGRRGEATTSELREMLGTTRRVAIPLLERLDRLGVTLRQADIRRLRTRAP